MFMYTLTYNIISSINFELFIVDHGCLNSQCANGSTCVSVSDKDYVCECPSGKRGKLCEKGKSILTREILKVPFIHSAFIAHSYFD